MRRTPDVLQEAWYLKPLFVDGISVVGQFMWVAWLLHREQAVGAQIGRRLRSGALKDSPESPRNTSTANKLGSNCVQ